MFSFSKKNVLRGLHLQSKKSQAKLITVVQGKILDVVVDLRKKSKTYGKHFMIEISQNSDFLFIFQKISLMVFFVYPKHVLFITNVQIIEIKTVRKLFYGMIKL